MLMDLIQSIKKNFENLGIIYSRAFVRIVLAKLCQVILAPVLAVQIVRWASRNSWWKANIVHRVPERCDLLLDANLWRTVLTVVFVITLGNVFLTMLTAILDTIFGVKKRPTD